LKDKKILFNLLMYINLLMVKICYFYLLFLLFITINTQENIQELREDLANTCQNKEIKVNTKLTMSYFTPW